MTKRMIKRKEKQMENFITWLVFVEVACFLASRFIFHQEWLTALYITSAVTTLFAFPLGSFIAFTAYFKTIDKEGP